MLVSTGTVPRRRLGAAAFIAAFLLVVGAAPANAQSGLEQSKSSTLARDAILEPIDLPEDTVDLENSYQATMYVQGWMVAGSSPNFLVSYEEYENNDPESPWHANTTHVTCTGVVESTEAIADLAPGTYTIAPGSCSGGYYKKFVLSYALPLYAGQRFVVMGSEPTDDVLGADRFHVRAGRHLTVPAAGVLFNDHVQVEGPCVAAFEDPPAGFVGNTNGAFRLDASNRSHAEELTLAYAPGHASADGCGQLEELDPVQVVIEVVGLAPEPNAWVILTQSMFEGNEDVFHQVAIPVSSDGDTSLMDVSDVTCTSATVGAAEVDRAAFSELEPGVYGLTGCSGATYSGSESVVFDYWAFLFVHERVDVNVTLEGHTTYGEGPVAFTADLEVLEGAQPPAAQLGVATDGLVCSAVLDPASDGTLPLDSSLPAGTYEIDGDSCTGVMLVGDQAFAYEVATVTGSVVVSKATTTTALTVPTPVAAGPVALSAEVSPSTTSGSVTFGVVSDSGPGAGCVAAVELGVASCTVDLEAGTHAVTATYTGDGNHEGSVSETGSIQAVLPPEITSDVPEGLVGQYSDPLASPTFTAADSTAPADLVWTLSGAPQGVTLDVSPDGSSATLVGPVDAAAGTYTTTVTVTDGLELGDGTHLSDRQTFDITVQREDARITFVDKPDPLVVTDPGGDLDEVTFDLLIEEPSEDTDPGDLTRADVSAVLIPVGPGGTVTASCLQPDAGGRSSCSFTDVPVNVYALEVTVGGVHYTGEATDVVTVFDPSLGFVTGGGSFLWPDTGERTTFGVQLTYTRKGQTARGNMLIVRHTADGDSYRIKSNQVSDLALGSTEAYGWAVARGKATYQEPTWPDAIGNHAFELYLEDHGTRSGSPDRLWLSVVDGNGVPVETSMRAPARDHTVALRGGNVQIPH